MSSKDEINVERSKLLNRQKAEKSAAQKEMKKKRGELLEAAQKKFEEMEARHERELQEFEAAHGGGAHHAAKAKETRVGHVKPVTVAQAKEMTKKELEEACGARGLGKKGSREDLVMRLIMWIQEHEDDEPAGDDAAEKGSVVPPPAAAKPAHHKKDDDDSDSDDGEQRGGWMLKKDDTAAAAAPHAARGGSARGRRGGRRGAAEQHPRKKEESDSEEEEEQQSPEDAAAAEEKKKQAKRVEFLDGAIRKLLRGHKAGIPVSELADLMIEEGLLRDPSALAPERFGAKSLEALLITMSGNGFFYESASSIIYPPQH